MANKTDFVEIGLACADVCRALDRGMNGRRLDGLSRSVREAVAQLTTQVQSMIHIAHGRLIALGIVGL